MGLVKKQQEKKDDGLDFSKKEIEFLLYLIQEGMIPGKRLSEAVTIVEKLQKQYTLFTVLHRSWSKKSLSRNLIR